MSKPPQPDLSLIVPVVTLPNSAAKDLYLQEVESYASVDDKDDDAYERKITRAFHSRELKQIDEIIESRKAYANKIFKLVVFWLIGVVAVILLSGFGPFGFLLDDKVLLALIGGTTLNVLGIFTIVANFLFPKNGHSILSRAQSEIAEKNKTVAASKPARPIKSESKSADEASKG